ncbi:hypothetical protein SLL00_03165 [Metabacillus indicus]|uniref:hypothetical protein n=1 Tax=Metabacillus indicus TaxID=246786 RepID=UPI002A056BC8|nr:hypothetical protein [Metabacillus indicus]MDX8288772.1 hypothetical protein [Metabacillus indicus]
MMAPIMLLSTTNLRNPSLGGTYLAYKYHQTQKSFSWWHLSRLQVPPNSEILLLMALILLTSATKLRDPSLDGTYHAFEQTQKSFSWWHLSRLQVPPNSEFLLLMALIPLTSSTKLRIPSLDGTYLAYKYHQTQKSFS